ncbi:MAG: Fe-S cluster assembly protein SufD [Microcoleaceae cyanobacterium]
MIQIQEKLEVSRLGQLLQLATAELDSDQNSLALTQPILQQIREDARSQVQELALPTRQDEDWRFTDLSDLLQLEFQAPQPKRLKLGEIEGLCLPEATQSRLVFVNGFYAPNLSNVAGLPNEIFVGSLEQLPENLQARLGDYLAQQPGEQEVFTALNTAGLMDAAVIWVKKNQEVETPIHVLLISTADAQPILTQPHVLVVAEAGSSARVIEHFATLAIGCSDQEMATPYLMNGVTELWLEENAELKHIRLQRDSGRAFHIGRTAVSQARHSRYTCRAVSLGAKLSRHNLDIYQTGEGTETTLQGLALVEQEQIADTHSSLLLNYPHGSCDQIHKVIADDQGAAVFNGRVVVSQAAQLTNANQLNRNLLLSPKARVNTKPQLEIVADDVKCTHGATVSQLEEDEIFYLQSRGLDIEASQQLLIDAFAGEILNQLSLDSLKTMLTRCVACRVDSV